MWFSSSSSSLELKKEEQEQEQEEERGKMEEARVKQHSRTFILYLLALDQSLWLT
jgi:hypothetical protein